MFQQCDQLKEQLDALRPLPPHTLKSLHEQLTLEWTYNSNAIEGNTLTLKETKVVLEGITIGGKSMREHVEAINHNEAIDYVEAVVNQQEPLSEQVIRSIHQLVLKNVDDDNAGRYRRENVVIAGAEHTPPDHLHVPQQMQELIRWHRSFSGHPIERAARLHTDFVKIHPFVDDNGRSARLLMNLDLMDSGYLPVIIKAADRLRYYETLDKAHTENLYDDFLVLVAHAEKNVLQHYLKVLVG